MAGTGRGEDLPVWSGGGISSVGLLCGLCLFGVLLISVFILGSVQMLGVCIYLAVLVWGVIILAYVFI